MKYEVRYEATYWVEANDEDEAIDLAIEQHSENPDGSWDAVRDPHASPLESLADGTYRIINGIHPQLVIDVSDGYWVAIEAVESLYDAKHDYLGVWTDANGERYYDRTIHINDRATAVGIGQAFNQLSIWDIKENKVIPLR